MYFKSSARYKQNRLLATQLSYGRTEKSIKNKTAVSVLPLPLFFKFIGQLIGKFF